LPQIGFLPPRDSRIRGTIAALGQHLLRDGFMFRYDCECAQDGVACGEGAFLVCSFWYADALAMIGRRTEAVAQFERVLSVRNELGLLSEEFDPRTHQLLGNFPQALSHLALVNTALNLQSKITG
jgi:GH15 family glucan-1,4-alpha-glucosidase